MLVHAGRTRVQKRGVFLINRNRPMWKMELRRHVEMIIDPDGCTTAKNHQERAIYIIEHYGIPLSDIGFTGGIEALGIEVNKSLERCNDRALFATKVTLIKAPV